MGARSERRRRQGPPVDFESIRRWTDQQPSCCRIRSTSTPGAIGRLLGSYHYGPIYGPSRRSAWSFSPSPHMSPSLISRISRPSSGISGRLGPARLSTAALWCGRARHGKFLKRNVSRGILEDESLCASIEQARG